MGVPTAQATLIDAFPGREERTMTRWAMLGVAGDLAAPLIMAGLVALSAGWRAAYILVGCLTATWAVAATRISMQALDAIERNDIARLPGGIFSRAFVRGYAQEVGLDPEETVRLLAVVPPRWQSAHDSSLKTGPSPSATR